METIGERVRRIRDAKGIERKALAKMAGLSYTGLASLEAGKAKSTTRLHSLADALEVSASYLETGKHHAPAAGHKPLPVERLDPEAVEDVIAVLHEQADDENTRYDERYAREFVAYYNARASIRDAPTTRRDILSMASRIRRTVHERRTDERTTPANPEDNDGRPPTTAPDRKE